MTAGSALRAESELIGWIAGENKLLQESLSWRLATLRAELAGPDSTRLEQLAAERVAICWLHTSHVDAKFVEGVRRGDMPLIVGDYFQRWQDRAHRRYLQSIKTLAQVRRLLGPSVQVNIAEKQVNVTG